MEVSKGTTLSIATNATGNEKTAEEYDELEWEEVSEAVELKPIYRPMQLNLITKAIRGL